MAKKYYYYLKNQSAVNAAKNKICPKCQNVTLNNISVCFDQELHSCFWCESEFIKKSSGDWLIRFRNENGLIDFKPFYPKKISNERFIKLIKHYNNTIQSISHRRAYNKDYSKKKQVNIEKIEYNKLTGTNGRLGIGDYAPN